MDVEGQRDGWSCYGPWEGLCHSSYTEGELVVHVPSHAWGCRVKKQLLEEHSVVLVCVNTHLTVIFLPSWSASHTSISRWKAVSLNGRLAVPIVVLTLPTFFFKAIYSYGLLQLSPRIKKPFFLCSLSVFFFAIPTSTFTNSTVFFKQVNVTLCLLVICPALLIHQRMIYPCAHTPQSRCSLLTWSD